MWKAVFFVLAAVLAVGFGGLAGGFRNIDVNDEGVQNALNFAVLHYNRGLNAMYRRDAVETVKARAQVVSGMNYEITVKMAETTCRKESTSETCPVIDSHQPRNYTCVFTVWSQPWMSIIELTKQKCDN
ncbi:cystatin C (amyloid angiopathy and cerebral hemorrhage) [Salarias fasciatus]|uniref:Cystatin-like n=1 Tax=Salarias fasciatus TaxID=181472 RepID=A0A672JIC7_SALFA|nr:cystatin-like [Salarias fasciatus]